MIISRKMFQCVLVLMLLFMNSENIELKQIIVFGFVRLVSNFFMKLCLLWVSFICGFVEVIFFFFSVLCSIWQFIQYRYRFLLIIIMLCSYVIWVRIRFRLSSVIFVQIMMLQVIFSIFIIVFLCEWLMVVCEIKKKFGFGFISVMICISVMVRKSISIVNLQENNEERNYFGIFLVS